MKKLLAFVAIALLAGCGFKPRAEIELPPALKTVRFENLDEFSPLRRNLGAALERAGATVVDTIDPAAGVIRIPVASMATEPLTISDAARVQEYVVRYTVELEVLDPAGAVILERAPIVLERDYSYDQTQALGAAAEEELLRKELEREMVQQILRRIERVRPGR